MSEFSPGRVAASEQLARFVFSPIHVRKNGKVKPALFSHVCTKGCSVQRDSIATTEEIATFLRRFLDRNSRCTWSGVLLASCADVRGILINDSNSRAVCVYDTAERGNPAHAEMCKTHHVVDEADRLELNKKLLEAFGQATVVVPDRYRDGMPALSSSQARSEPTHERQP